MVSSRFFKSLFVSMCVCVSSCKCVQIEQRDNHAFHTIFKALKHSLSCRHVDDKMSYLFDEYVSIS